ncbi:MAG: N-acetylmuramoyl-L-alanine amidase [Flavobacteriales bacterium]|nr:N-acetylmuramoyl-L-alanine amidase [Flavobacteriales bacterium]
MHAQSILKRSIFLFLVFTLNHFLGFGQTSNTPYRIKTIVIDAGHGGKDPGNLGTGRYKTREKDIALEVALRVGSYINQQFPEIKLIYSRSTDVFIGLDERAEIANKAKADLFISIHCNAFAKPTSSGVETYVLGLHRNQENLEVAMKENSAIFLEDDYKTKYDGFDPNSPESIIALTIMQSAFLQQSLSISSYVQKQFRERVGRKDRGVKQAGFLVLRRTTMPSVLIELGFLTNAEEEDFLNSENGKSYMSSAIFRGFKEYKELVEDPLPAGSVVQPVKPAEPTETTTISDAEKKKAEALAAAEKAKLKADQDAKQKALDQQKLKAVADSLQLAKQRLLDEKTKREEELAKKGKEDEAARLKAKSDSLELVKQEKIAEFERKQREVEEQKKKELAELKAKEEAELKAKEAEAKKELESKQQAKEWLEEIKEVKEKELEEAKARTEIDAEKERLEAIKKKKEEELAEAKRLADEKSTKQNGDSLAVLRMIKEQSRIDSISKARADGGQFRKDSIAVVEAAKKAKMDSIAAVVAAQQAQKEALRKAEEQEARRLAKLKFEQDSIAAARKKEADAIAVTIDAKKAASPEEAELLFLQLRKKQLEQRIAQLKGQNVQTVTTEKLEERTNSTPESEPEHKVDAAVVAGLVLKVQVVTSSKPLDKNDLQFRGQDVWQYEQGGLYKYTVGHTQDFEEITKLQGDLRNLGFQGAFVVAFKDGERIKVAEARELLTK